MRSKSLCSKHFLFSLPNLTILPILFNLNLLDPVLRTIADKSGLQCSKHSTPAQGRQRWARRDSPRTLFQRFSAENIGAVRKRVPGAFQRRASTRPRPVVDAFNGAPAAISRPSAGHVSGVLAGRGLRPGVRPAETINAENLLAIRDMSARPCPMADGNWAIANMRNVEPVPANRPTDPPDAVYLAHSTLRSTASGRRWALVWAGIYTDPSTPRSWQSAG